MKAEAEVSWFLCSGSWKGADVIPKGCPACPLLSGLLMNLQKKYSARLTKSSLHEPEAEVCARVSSPSGVEWARIERY